MRMRGAEGLNRDFQRAVRGYVRARQKSLRKAGQKVRKQVVLNLKKGHDAPNPMGRRGHLRVRTSRLWQSIQVQVEGTKRVRIGTNVIYSRIHEVGGIIENGWGRGITIEIPPRPYLGPGLMAAEDDIGDEFVVMYEELLPGN